MPAWITTEQSCMDFIVIASGIVENVFGVLMAWGRKLKVGIALVIFHLLIFPGNIDHMALQQLD